jgi:hypothetical protein
MRLKIGRSGTAAWRNCGWSNGKRSGQSTGWVNRFGDGIAERLKILDKTGQNVLTEIDLLLENGEYSIAVEVKSQPVLKDVAHQERRLEILREYKNRRNDPRKIRGGIAGAVFPEGVKEAAIEAGLYVTEQSGDTMKISVPKGFIPREW